MAKSLVILSHKSCGSSACLRLLASISGVRTIAHSRHYQNESLYWTKAASILARPQLRMHASEVPIPRRIAKQDLLALLRANAPAFDPPQDEEALVFEGWRALCLAHEPVFVEKSPHHLYQRSCLDLMEEATTRLTDVQFHFLGLIRNPMDVVYSQWRRWRSLPERVQEEWVIAYRNLQEFKARMGAHVTLVRYEDLVSGLGGMKPVFEFCGVERPWQSEDDLHQRSVAKWRNDSRFGFGLSEEAFALAGELGYEPDELPERRPSTKIWPLLRSVSRAAHSVTWPLRRGKSLVLRVVRVAAR
jgi:Sulfotransferase family